MSIDRFTPQVKESGYEKMLEIDERVKRLDPLLLDNFLVNFLPKVNEKGDIEKIMSVINSLDLSPERLKRFSLEESLAAVRDLNMLFSSLRKNGYNLGKNSKIEKALIILSQKTQEVPTDTVFSYGTRNPTDARMRTFTGLKEERLFIESFRNGMINLPSAIKALEELTDLSLDDIMFSEKVKSAQKSFEEMISAIVAVRRNITPELFTMQLRPFFEPKKIGGKVYQASGGAQMPIVLIDQLLWGSGVENEMYKKYFDENIQYQPIFLREKAELFSKQQPLIQRALKVLEKINMDDKGRLEIIKKSLQSIYDLLSFIEKFRKPHLKIAEDNMRIRPEGSVGSGGYDVAILHFLLENITLYKNIISKKLIEMNS